MKRKRNSHLRFDIGFLKTNEIKLRSGATSLFDVQRWTFDVRCLSFKTILYGTNVTYECLQDKLALMGSLGVGDQGSGLGISTMYGNKP